MRKTEEEGKPVAGPLSQSFAASDVSNSADMWILSHRGFVLLTLYEIVIFLLLVWEMFAIPFRFAFVFENPLAFLIFEAVVDAVFVFDTVLRFFWPYLSKRGQYIKGPQRKIASHYAKTWAVPNMIAAIPWNFALLFLTMANPAYAATLYWLPYCLLTRGVRLPQVFIRLWEWELVIDWSFDPVVLRATSIVLASLMWVSLNGCLFWMIALLENRPWSWINIQDPNKLMQQGPFVQYMAALYWSMVTFSTCGFGDIGSTTLATRIFTIFYCLLSIALLAYATANVVTWLQSANAAQIVLSDKLSEVKQYSEYRGFSDELHERLLTFHRLKGLNDVFPHNDKVVLDMLSSGLRLRLSAQLRKTLFKNWELMQICDDAFVAAVAMRMKRESRYPGQYIAVQGSKAKKFFLLSSGHAEVSMNGVVLFDMISEGGSEPAPIFEESVLFREDASRSATLRAVDFCDLIFLKMSDLEALLKLYPNYVPRISAYAAQLDVQYHGFNGDILSELRQSAPPRIALVKIPFRLFAEPILNDPQALAEVMASVGRGLVSDSVSVFSGTRAVDWLMFRYDLKKREDACYLGRRLLRSKLIVAEQASDFEDDEALLFRFTRAAKGGGATEPTLDDCFSLEIRGVTPTAALVSMFKENPDFQLALSNASPSVTVLDNKLKESNVFGLERDEIDASSSDEVEEAGLFRKKTVFVKSKKK